MARAEISTTIDRSVEIVFTVLTDVTKNAIWSSTAVEGRLITPGPVDGGTRVTATFEAKLGHFFKVGDSLFAIVGRRNFKRDLATLKRLMEAGKL